MVIPAMGGVSSGASGSGGGGNPNAFLCPGGGCGWMSADGPMGGDDENLHQVTIGDLWGDLIAFADGVQDWVTADLNTPDPGCPQCSHLSSGGIMAIEATGIDAVLRTYKMFNPDRVPEPGAVPEESSGAMGALKVGMAVTVVLLSRGEALKSFRVAEEGALGSGRAYSVAFETTLDEAGVGTRAAHFKAANIALSESLSGEAMEELGISVPRSNAGTILGESPSDWTWHHVPDQPGVMQLVPRAMHRGSIWQPLLHPGGIGGFKLWGADY
jgi:A nuclease of the HNH/ENDO VII superfamily with conserved WHH